MLRAWGGRAVRRLTRADAVGVFLLALVARLVQLLYGGSATGLNAYDQSVYYAAADALLHGRIPYRGDFVFLHPPGVVLVGLPFALLGRITTAATGFLTENIVFGVLGACTAGLVTVVARRAGVPRWGALAGGAFYAAWNMTVAAGSTARLEPLGDVLFVLAVLLLATGRVSSRRQLVLAGVVFGLLLSVKLWWAVPILLVFSLAAPIRRGLRAAALVPLAAAVTVVVVDLPFLVLSRGHMVFSILSVQLGRSDVQHIPTGAFGRLPTMVRLERLTGVEAAMARLGFGPSQGDIRVAIVTLVVCVLVLLTSAVALRTTLGRVFVPVLAAEVVVLFAAPTYFPYYGDFVGVALALVIAAAARPARWSLRPFPWAFLWPVAAAFTLALLLTTPRASSVVDPPDDAALIHATKDIGCIVADTPRLLIDLDALDRSFENGCPNWVDFQGVGHGAGPDPAAYIVGPHATRAWKEIMTRYFLSGDAVALSDPNVRDLLGESRVRLVTSGQLVAESHGVTVYLTPRPPDQVR